jgi:histidine phosphotransferase ChpT
MDLRVLELIASKLCHDLIGPVTGLTTGIELAKSGDGTADAETVNLLAFSASQAAKRLAFFRLAYGLGGSEGEQIERTQLEAICNGLIEDSRVAAVWPPSAPGLRLRKEEARLFLNLFALGREALPKGGVIRPVVDEVLAVICEGAGVRTPEGLEEVLADAARPETLTPRTVHAYLTWLLAERAGKTLHLETRGPEALCLALRAR